MKLRITNILGETIINAVDEVKDAGIYEYHFNAAYFSSGVYFYDMTAGNFREVRKMALVR